MGSEASGPSFIGIGAKFPLKTVEREFPDDGKYHGVFTWALLKGLRGAAIDENGVVTAKVSETGCTMR